MYAKFIYRMQNILNIKYKLEESAKQEYAEARQTHCGRGTEA